MTEIVIAVILAVAAGVVLWAVLPERFRAPVLGVLGAVLAVGLAVAGRRPRRRPEAPHDRTEHETAMRRETVVLDQADADHERRIEEIDARPTQPEDEQLEQAAARWRNR